MDRIWKGRGSKKGISRAGTAQASAWRQDRAGSAGGPGQQRAAQHSCGGKHGKLWEAIPELGSMGHWARGIVIEIPQTKVSMSDYVQEMLHALSSL